MVSWCQHAMHTLSHPWLFISEFQGDWGLGCLHIKFSLTARILYLGYETCFNSTRHRANLPKHILRQNWAHAHVNDYMILVHLCAKRFRSLHTTPGAYDIEGHGCFEWMCHCQVICIRFRHNLIKSQATHPQTTTGWNLVWMWSLACH